VLQYVARRLLWMIPTLLGITMLIFTAIHAAPGDPATVMIGAGSGGAMQDNVDYEAKIAKVRRDLGLDLPLWKQYLTYLGPVNFKANGHPRFGGNGEDKWTGLLVLDLGSEFQRKGVPVVEELGRRLQVTIPLALIATLLTYLIAIPLGIYSANRQGTLLDGAISLSLFVLYSIPGFWMGLVLILLFGRTGLDLLPVVGLHSADASDFSGFAHFRDLALHCVLPVITMTYGGLAYLSRQMRVGMIDVIRQDYIRTARAKGLSERTVVLKHALRNSLIPVITLFASVLPILIGGSIIVEYVFSIPGMGGYVYSGLLLRDYNVIMATTTFSAVMTLLGILLSDIAYALVDPRIAYD
jgi:ABC-type dipeptide/oligopeptide/nickel transport system permease component